MYKLLIADDEWTQRHAFKKLLRDWGTDFDLSEEAEDGKEALKAILNDSFDAVFTDIRMPVIDGIELLKEIHEIDNSIPVILISTYTDFEYAKQGIEFGAFDYLVKPINKDKFKKLLEKLKLYLDNKAKSKEIQDNIKKTLSDKIDSEFQQNYEEVIYSLLFNDTSELALYINDLVKIQFSRFNGDYFKLGIMFENLIRKIEDRFNSSFEYAKKIFPIVNISREHLMSQKSKETFTEAVKKEFERIAEFIRCLHFEQSDSIIKDLCQYAFQESEKKPTLDDAAVRLNYNKDYLRKLFKSKTGESYSQYCAKIQMEYAKKLIHGKLYKNYEISEMLGYKDVDYFSKLFRDYTGFSPSEYRKQCKTL